MPAPSPPKAAPTLLPGDQDKESCLLNCCRASKTRLLGVLLSQPQPHSTALGGWAARQQDEEQEAGHLLDVLAAPSPRYIEKQPERRRARRRCNRRGRLEDLNTKNARQRGASAASAAPLRCARFASRRPEGAGNHRGQAQGGHEAHLSRGAAAQRPESEDTHIRKAPRREEQGV